MTETAAARLEAAMTDTCTIRRATGPDVYDDDTGELTPAAPTTVYTGGCMFTDVGTLPNNGVRGGQQEYATRYQVSVPRDEGPFQIGDVVTMDASADADAVGETFVVRTVTLGTHVARRRLGCDRIETGPRR